MPQIAHGIISELSKLASCLPDVKSGKSVSAEICLAQEASCGHSIVRSIDLQLATVFIKAFFLVVPSLGR